MPQLGAVDETSWPAGISAKAGNAAQMFFR
jgi:hypothetical protein